MKANLFFVFFFCGLNVSAQYYYKDIVGTKETSDMIRAYQKNKVSRVLLTSLNATNQKDENFLVEQHVSTEQQTLTTLTRSYITDESVLVSFFDAKGNVIRTIDSSDRVISITTYEYDTSGHLNLVSSSSSDSAQSSMDMELHIWTWSNGRPAGMLRIRNQSDTSQVNFKLDERGDIGEEAEIRKGKPTPPVYYYYNDFHQLTDIARYSRRANRLLPEYLFEFSEGNQLSQKITVPANSSEYLIWRYQYNSRGLKTREVIYNKQKKLVGKIEYQYFYGS